MKKKKEEHLSVNVYNNDKNNRKSKSFLWFWKLRTAFMRNEGTFTM